jgi:cobalt-zinc-cadmium efflux system protein
MSHNHENESNIGYTMLLNIIITIAALINVVTIMIIAILIFSNAIQRFGKVTYINGLMVIALAGLSIIVNGSSVFLLKKESKESINMRAAYMHMFSDLLTSIAVLIAGVIICFTEITWIDSVLSIVIAIYLVVVTIKMFFETVKVLMQFAPENFKPEKIKELVENINEVKNIHHMHAWQLTDNLYHFEAHIEFKNDVKLSESNKILKEVKDILMKEEFTHITLEPEFESNHSSEAICIECLESEHEKYHR